MASKSIETLVDDIYSTFNGNPFSSESIRSFGEALGITLSSRITDERSPPSLRVSNLGSPCERKLWYSIHQPERGEPLPSNARFKFLYGDLLEELLLFLAEQAGHRVEGRQQEVSINGVVGHIDAIIDGRLVDVKSASTFAFKKFAQNGLREDDPFGYLDQIGAYAFALRGDPKVTERDVVSFLAVDKQLGNIVLDTYPTPNKDYGEVVKQKQEMLKGDLPERGFSDEPEGKSGNRKLGTQCSYCDFKRTCYPSLRTFIYSTGPTYLTWVEREPKVPEVT